MIRFVKGWNCLDSMEWHKQQQQLLQPQLQLPGDPRQQGEEDRGRSPSLNPSLTIRVIMETLDITHFTAFTMTLGMVGETETERRELVREASTLKTTTAVPETRVEVPD